MTGAWNIALSSSEWDRYRGFSKTKTKTLPLCCSLFFKKKRLNTERLQKAVIFSVCEHVGGDASACCRSPDNTQEFSRAPLFSIRIVLKHRSCRIKIKVTKYVKKHYLTQRIKINSARWPYWQNIQQNTNTKNECSPVRAGQIWSGLRWV